MNPYHGTVPKLIVMVSLMALGEFSQAQTGTGDQILDGIGETALRARYVFDGNAEDRSRNSHHAQVHGMTDAYVDDERFGRVLTLDGNDGHVEIPPQAVTGLDSVSITGWVNVRSEEPWQRFFDFGVDTRSYLFCTPIGETADEGMRTRITTTGWTEEVGPVGPRIELNRWVHIAVVLDAARQTLTTYVDGRRIGRATDVEHSFEDVLDQEEGQANQLFLGKSLFTNDANLDAKLYDVRIYSIALNRRQVATIFRNAGREAQVASSSDQDRGQQAADMIAGDYAEKLGLRSVPDITVETTVGHLPRLPHEIPAEYDRGSSSGNVRVIWPSPKGNDEVLSPTTYVVTGVVAGTEFRPKATVVVKPAESTSEVPQRTLEPFPLGDVVLEKNNQQQDTKFIENRDKFFRGLAQTDPDRFLYMFRDAFGQPQPEGVEPLGGWDSQTTRLRGHASGHYLTAIAQAHASTTYDEQLQSEFRQKMDYLIDTLYDLANKSGEPAEPGGPSNSDPAMVPPGPGRDGYDSDLSADGIRTDYWNWGEGFISAYPPDQFIMLEQGATYGGRNHQIWAPYYTLHKILAGLLDCYEVSGNEKALEVAKGMGLWVHARLSQVPPATRIEMWNRYIAGEYGGMNEVLARLYRLTDDERFLESAKLFDNVDFFFGDADHSHGLARYVDTIRGKHANQHIPQITGALETFRATGDMPYFHVAENFWDICTNEYAYSIGGVAGARNPRNAECFTAEPETLFANGFADGAQNETCATYNLLKLTRELFMFTRDAKYMDYYEQALYNHILASVAEDNAGNTYHVPLNPGSRKRFGNARMNGFSCCNGTALESSTKLQDSIYFRSKDDDALYVNLYVPSTLDWKQRDVVVRQSTSFPYEDTSQLEISGEGEFTVNLRVPRWAKQGFEVRINGEQQQLNAVPGEYLALNRNWSDGDTIEVKMPMSFHLMRVMDQPNLASIFYGPVLLAAEEPAARSNWRTIALDAEDPGQSITGDAKTLRFEVGDAKLKPFFDTYDRHSVYLDVSLE